MRVCTGCSQKKPLEEFHRNRTKSEGRLSRCKDCQNRAVRYHYQENRPYYLAKARRRNRQQRNEIREMLNRLKDVPCARCGGTFPPCAMDFHHLSSDKLFELGRAHSRSVEQLLEEVAKCEILCSNCHRVAHHECP